jgi:DNA-directed RNA polymerase subunit RPC12/RpoP
VKFSCDRCGKKYATAEAPAPGRVYKLKCKACGHLIVVKTPAAGATVGASLTPSPPPSEATSTASSIALPAAQPPEVTLEVEAPPGPPPAMTPVPTRASEPTAEISMMAPVEPSKSPSDGGYVDIFADGAPAATPPSVADDPFLKARGGGEDAGAPLVDPFADMRDELEGAKPAEPTAPPPPVAEPPPGTFAPPPRPAEDKKKGGLPVALIGIGFVAMIGIVVAVALKSGKKPEVPPAPPPVAAQPKAEPQPPPPEPVKAEPVKAEPVKPKAEPAVARKDDRKREEAARAEAAARQEAARQEAARQEAARREELAKREADRKRAEEEKKRAEADRKRAEEDKKRAEEERKRLAKADAAKPVQLPDAASALSPEAVQKVVNASRRAFEACIAEAAKKGTDTKFDGRRVALRLNVNPNGFVTYPTLDDVTLNRTDLGECLKAAARLMVFPKFQGDVFHVEVPLTLRGG